MSAAKNLKTPTAGLRTPKRFGASIAVLAGLSGACGLAYEILYIRLFTNYFGDSFLITGVTLCAVFLGMGFGAWMSSRFIRWLGGIEIAIGLFAFAVAWGFSNWGFEIATTGGTPTINALKLSLLLGLPAFLIGTCVPLFTAYANRKGDEARPVFSRIYGLYNLGAFLSVLAIEFVLFREFGLKASLFLIGCLNLTVGAALLLQGHHKEHDYDIAVIPRSGGLDKRIAVALFLASLASGVFQLFMLRLSFSIFGPLQENFAIILAAAILGVAIGAALSTRLRLTLGDVLSWLAVAILILMVFVPALVQSWTWMAGASLGDGSETFIKIILLAGFPLPVFVLLGSLVPLALAAHDQNDIHISGRLLAISSLGNGLGSLAMFALIYRVLDLPQIGLGLVGALLISSVIAVGKQSSPRLFIKNAVIYLTLAFSVIQAWPKIELLLGYRIIAQPDQLKNRLQEFDEVATYKAYDQSASVLSFRDGSRSVVFNGYHSLSFGPGGKSDLHETIVGATPALFTNTTDQALVLGLGTGISAGAAARVFDQTRVVEINPAILNIPAHFEPENHNVMSRSNTEIVLQDGLSVLLGSDHNYDAIINTVTSPKYFAASKLYTRDFLELVKARLTDKGVYSTWFDLNIDRDGIAIMLNTLEASFAHCRYFVLTASYFNAVCADHPLIYQSRPVAQQRFGGLGFDELLAKHGLTQGFGPSLSGLEVSFDKAFFARATDEINMLDRPLIEFVVARNADKDATAEALANLLVSNIERQRQFSGGRQVWKENCKMIALMSYLEFSGCK